MRPGREFRLLLVMCAVFFVCAWVSLRLSTDNAGIYCIWLGNAVISAFVLTVPSRWKPAFFLVGHAVGLGVDFMQGNPFWASCWCTFSNCGEVLVTVLPLRHFATRADVVSQRSLLRIAYFGVLLGPLTGGLLGAQIGALEFGQPYLEALLFWFLSEALGGAAGLTAMLLFLTIGKGETAMLRARATSILTWSSPLVIATLVVFWQTRYPVMFLIIPPLLLVLFRFELTGSIFGTSLIVIVGAIFTSESHGPFRLFRGDPPTEQAIIFHVFGLTLIFTFIAVGFALEERVRLEAALRQANQKLQDLTLVDALTGLRNRRGFDLAIQLEWSSASATGNEVSLLFIDIDFFKHFNDTYGHQLGDDCLKSVACALTTNVRSPEDCVARFGGEEFVIALPQTSADSARMTAERITATIADLKIPHTGSPFGIVTASVGVATGQPQSGGSPAGLVRSADEALYTAKRNGRNRIETYLEGESCALVLLERAG